MRQESHQLPSRPAKSTPRSVFLTAVRTDPVLSERIQSSLSVSGLIMERVEMKTSRKVRHVREKLGTKRQFKVENETEGPNM